MSPDQTHFQTAATELVSEIVDYFDIHELQHEGWVISDDGDIIARGATRDDAIREFLDALADEAIYQKFHKQAVREIYS